MLSKKLTLAAASMAVLAEAQLTKLEVLGQALSDFNMGAMKSMVRNPDDINSHCIDSVNATNAELLTLFDYGTYEGGSFNL